MIIMKSFFSFLLKFLSFLISMYDLMQLLADSPVRKNCRLLLNSEHTILVSGVDLQFHWDEVEAFERQPDGSLFSWFERYCCYRHIIYGIVS